MQDIKNPIKRLIDAIQTITKIEVEDIAKVSGIPAGMVDSVLRREAEGLEITGHGNEVLDKLLFMWVAVTIADIPVYGEDRISYAMRAWLDTRVEGVMSSVFEIFGPETLYEMTGIDAERLVVCTEFSWHELRTLPEWRIIRATILREITPADAWALAWDVQGSAPVARQASPRDLTMLGMLGLA